MRLSRFNASLTDTPPWRFATHSTGTFQEQILLRTKKTPNNQILTFTQHLRVQDFRLPACEKNELGRGALGQDLTAASETWAYVHLCNADMPTTSQASLFQRKPLMPRVGFPLPALLHPRSGHSTRTRLPRCWWGAAPLCRIPARAGGQDGAAALLRVPRRVSLHAPPPACLQQPPWSSRSACNRSRQTQIGGGLQWKALPCAYSGSAAQPSCAGAGVTYGSAVPCLPVKSYPRALSPLEEPLVFPSDCRRSPDLRPHCSILPAQRPTPNYRVPQAWDNWGPPHSTGPRLMASGWELSAQLGLEEERSLRWKEHVKAANESTGKVCCYTCSSAASSLSTMTRNSRTPTD